MTTAASNILVRRAWSRDDPRFNRVAGTRAQVLESAGRLFIRQGYAATSMEAIALDAGIAKMTLYRHFRDKGTLFVEVINAKTATLIDVAKYSTAISRSQAEDLLKRFAREFIRSITAPEVLALYQALLGEVARFPDLGRTFYDFAVLRSVAIAEHILSLLLPPEAVGTHARAFMHMIMGDAYQRLLLGKLELNASEALFDAQITLATRLVLSDIGER